ncbi:hypothetical protein INR49_032159 [Caranx melampygus]|nr:hypothetical protein INR49_032159 [Caranx melampygus]
MGAKMYTDRSTRSGPIEILEMQVGGMLVSYTDRPRLIRDEGATAEAKHQPSLTQTTDHIV